MALPNLKILIVAAMIIIIILLCANLSDQAAYTVDNSVELKQINFERREEQIETSKALNVPSIVDIIEPLVAIPTPSVQTIGDTPSPRMTQQEFEQVFGYPDLYISYSYVCKLDLLCPFITNIIKTTFGAVDVTELYLKFVSVQHINALPETTMIWCTQVIGTNVVERCLFEALARKNSPMGNIKFTLGTQFRLFLARFIKSKEYDPSLLDQITTLLFDEQFSPVTTGDKAGYSIKLLQLAPSEIQDEVLKFMPRSYYVNTPCYKMNESSITYDQWDLWLKNLDFDVTEYLRDRPEHILYLDPNNRNWDKKQPRIEGQNTWVVKPTIVNLKNEAERGSSFFHLHQGNAIHIVKTPENLFDAITKDHIEYKRDCISDYRIVQKYIENPFLWDGKKADIRVYVFVTSLNPHEAYIYTAEFPVRVARSDYNTTDERAHVTNFSKAQKEDNVDNMHYWEEFIEFICSTVNEPREILEPKLIAKLKDMINAVLRLFPSRSNIKGATSLSGWDVIFDNDLNPWMMEINPKPDMRMDMSHMSKFKIPLVTQAVELGLMLVKGEKPEFYKNWIRV